MEGRNSSGPFLSNKAAAERLARYGATDDKGFVHVPIDEAMRHARRGDTLRAVLIP